MNTLNFLDANVWLALIWSRNVHSERARLWFEQAGEEQFFFCRFTQLSVLRLRTTDQIMGKDTKTMSEAGSLWHRVWGDTRIVFLPEPDDIEKEFRSRSRLSSQSRKVWTDAYLHHHEFRSHSGDDSAQNLITVCAICHEQLHRGRENAPGPSAKALPEDRWPLPVARGGP